MAFLADDDKLKGNEDENQNQGSMGTGESSGFVSGGGGTDVGSGTGASSGVAGVAGKGGAGGWTNIQAYLNANKQDTGSSDYANQKLGGAFDEEKSNLDKSASDETAKANSQSNKINEARGNYKTAIQNAGQAYDWSGNQSKAYTDSLNPIKSAITDQYSGPNKFAWGFGDKTQKAKEAAGDDNAFTGWLENSYQERAGKPMSGGQLALQRQFDVTNDPLANVRKNLLEKYSGLETYRDQKVKDTDAAFGKAAQDYGNAQNTLKSDLSNYGNQLDTERASAEAGARSGYDKSFNSDSGRQNYGFTNMDLLDRGAGESFAIADQLMNSGVGGTGPATWKQLSTANHPVISENAMNLYRRAPLLIWGGKDRSNEVQGLMDSSIEQNKSALNNFYNTETAKYADTGDSQKRQYNAIMDLLGGEKRTKGFNVRG